MLYSGPVGQAAASLVSSLRSTSGAGPMPASVNPADWMMSAIDAPSVSVSAMAARFQSSLAGAAVQSEVARAVAVEAAAGRHSVDDTGTIPNCLTRFCLLLQRSCLVYWRDHGYNTTRVIVLLGVALLFGSAYFQLQDTDQAGVYSVIGATYMAANYAALLLMASSIPPVILARPYVSRQVRLGYYSAEAHALATSLVEIAWLLIIGLMFSSIFYFLLGLDPYNFWGYFGAQAAISVVFVLFGHVVANTASTQQAALGTANAIMSLTFVFAGFVVPASDMAVGWRWIHRVVPIRHALGALVVQAFHCPDGQEDHAAN